MSKFCMDLESIIERPYSQSIHFTDNSCLHTSSNLFEIQNSFSLDSHINSFCHMEVLLEKFDFILVYLKVNKHYCKIFKLNANSLIVIFTFVTFRLILNFSERNLYWRWSDVMQENIGPKSNLTGSTLWCAAVQLTSDAKLPPYQVLHAFKPISQIFWSV